MKKSIYFKLVVMFVLTIILGTILSFVLIYNLYFDKIYKQANNLLVDAASDISMLYTKSSSDDFEKVMSTNLFSNYYVEIYNGDKKIKSYGDNKSFYMSDEAKEKVEKQKIYINNTKLNRVLTPKTPIVGYPFKVENKNHAVFMYLNVSDDYVDGTVLLEINILVMILTGVITFTIVGKMIVKRVKFLTMASRQISRGNYDIKVEDKGKDELSELSETFNLMAKRIGKTEKMRKEFVSNVSHEIQSPITSIMGFANILQSDCTDSDKKTYAKIIEEESRRLSRLSENLLKLASLDNDQDKLNKSKYYLDEQIRRVVLMLEPKWYDKNIKFDLILPKTEIYADIGLLEQVWINIIDNSIKFSENNSKIYIQIKKYDCVIDISIKDEGIGISEEDLSKIFDRFHQSDESRRVEGSGLGLSIARKIIILHEGNIRAKSQLGLGTEFTISFRN